MKLILLTFLSLFLSCVSEQNLAQLNVEKTGRNIAGEVRSCVEARDLICNAVYTEQEAFADDCVARGFEVVACGCHDYLCQDLEEVSGLDLNGNPKSCVPSLPSVCTTEFTLEDEFAEDCKTNGGEAVQCGCHDWLCQ
jgi:hypothetical protein